MTKIFLVTLHDAGDFLGTWPFASHEEAAKFFEAMVEDGWEAEINEAGVETAEEAIEAMRNEE